MAEEDRSIFHFLDSPFWPATASRIAKNQRLKRSSHQIEKLTGAFKVNFYFTRPSSRCQNTGFSCQAQFKSTYWQYGGWTCGNQNGSNWPRTFRPRGH